jgi:hypothetical protein
MAWFRRQTTDSPPDAPPDSPPEARPVREGVTLLTAQGTFRKKVTETESAELSDRATVRRWVRGLRPGLDQTVLVDRPWGTVTVTGHPVTVLLTDGENAWFAVAPGAPDSQDLTPGQVEHVVLDALMSPDRPQWPDWRPI